MVTICSALLVVPLILFSSIAGPTADKYEKSRLVRITKFIEIFIMAGAFYGFQTQNIYLLMFMLFVSGTHTTFYSPIKFSILPDHLNSGELLAGNGFHGERYLPGRAVRANRGRVARGNARRHVIGYTAIGRGDRSVLSPACSHSAVQKHRIRKRRSISISGKATRDIIAYAYRNKTILFSTLALSWFSAYQLGLYVAIRQLRAKRGARE